MLFALDRLSSLLHAQQGTAIVPAEAEALHERELKSVDVFLRARHTSLANEFSCAAAELQILKTELGTGFPRTVEAFCTEPRAEHFSKLLESFKKSCADCIYLVQRDETEHLAPMSAP